MKLISWNVNGIRACLQKGFEDAFRTLNADFFCLQETKAQPHQVELDLPGYRQYWYSAEKKGYSGTAIFARYEPLAVTYGVGVEELDHEGRLITLEYEAGTPVGAENAIRALLSRDALVVTKKSKKAKSGETQVDLIPLIHRVDYEGRRDALTLNAVLRAQNPGLNPALILEAIGRECPQAAPDYVSYHRKRVLDREFQPYE